MLRVYCTGKSCPQYNSAEAQSRYFSSLYKEIIDEARLALLLNRSGLVKPCRHHDG